MLLAIRQEASNARHTHFTTEEKIRVVLGSLQGQESIRASCPVKALQKTCIILADLI